jgi:hypothetical protein
LNKVDRDLFLLGLKRGDLVQLHSDKIEEDKPASTKVIVGSGFIKDESTPNWMSTTWHFRYIDSGSLAIYLNRLISSADFKHSFWNKFHRVHCGGTTCIVHEKFLYPINWVYDPNNLTITDDVTYNSGSL